MTGMFPLERDKSELILPTAHSIMQTNPIGSHYILSEGISPNAGMGMKHN